MHKYKIIIKITAVIVSIAISSVMQAVSFGADTLRTISFSNAPDNVHQDVQTDISGSLWAQPSRAELFSLASQSKIKVVFFDIGNVINFFDSHRASQAIAEYCGIPEKENEIYLAMRSEELLGPLETGLSDLTDYFEKLSQKFGLKIDYPTFVGFYTDIYEANPPVWAVMRQLKEAGYKIGVITNTDEVMFQHESNVFKGVFGMIDIFVTSYEVGVKKPDEKIFKKALEKAGVKPEQAVFIDDIADYVRAFSSLGGTGIQYTPDMDLYKEVSTALSSDKRSSIIERQPAYEIKNEALQVILQSA